MHRLAFFGDRHVVEVEKVSLALRTSVAVSAMVARVIELRPSARMIASSAGEGAPQPRIIKQHGARRRRAFPRLAADGGGVNSVSAIPRFARGTKDARTPALRRHRQPHRGGRGGGA